jgi:hypothetical protein
MDSPQESTALFSGCPTLLQSVLAGNVADETFPCGFLHATPVPIVVKPAFSFSWLGIP